MAAGKKNIWSKFAKFIGIEDDPQTYTEENDVEYGRDRSVPSYASQREKRTITPETAAEAKNTSRRERVQDTSRFSAPEPRTSAPSGQRSSERTSSYRQPSYDRDRNDRGSRSSRELPRERDVRETREMRPRRSNAPVPNETIIASAGTIEETRPLINALVRGYTIVLTIDAPDETVNRRILDTFCGAVFALKATIQSAPGAYNTYVIAPRSSGLRFWEDYSDDMR